MKKLVLEREEGVACTLTLSPLFIPSKVVKIRSAKQGLSVGGKMPGEGGNIPGEGARYRGSGQNVALPLNLYKH